MGIYRLELAHHGILGQKWGIRRFQNRDGSLTNAGKARYSDVQKDVKEALESKKEIADRIMENGPKIQEMADDTGRAITESYKTAKLSKEQKDSIEKKLYDDFGVGCDDEAMYDMMLDDYINEELDNSISKEAKDKRQQFDKFQEDYWNDINSIASDIVEKYKDTKISDNPYYNNGRMAVNKILGDSLNTSVNSYIYKHFDDYWVNDTDERYEAVERLKKEFSLDMDAYNKKYGKV